MEEVQQFDQPRCAWIIKPHLSLWLDGKKN